MIFCDFDIQLERTDDDARRINMRVWHIAESLRQWIRNASPRISAPFRKLVISLVVDQLDVDTASPVIDAVCAVNTHVSMDALLGPYEGFRSAVVSAVQRALVCVENEHQWSDAAFASEVVAWLHRGPGCRVLLPKLSKRARNGRQLDVWLTVTETDANISGEISGPSEHFTRELANTKSLTYPEYMFPAIKVVSADGKFRLVDRSGEVLAEL